MNDGIAHVVVPSQFGPLIPTIARPSLINPKLGSKSQAHSTAVATLAVTDAKGARSTSDVQIVAGNDPPQVAVDIVGGNRSFYFPGSPIRYPVRVPAPVPCSLDGGQLHPVRLNRPPC